LVLDQGRLPQKPDEVAATVHFLKSSGLRGGSQLTARGLNIPYRIVGAYELPSDLAADQVNALPGALLAPLSKALAAEGLTGTHPSTTQLVSVPGGFTWNMVKQANARGVTVVSRAVTLHPPARADVPLFQRKGWGSTGGGSSSRDELTVTATIVGLAMLEICLLAGPAFAVGARRSRRQLGLVGANGGDHRHIRAIVLAGGLVIGVASAVIGTALGLGLTVVLRSVLENAIGQRFGSFDIRPLELLGIALLAVVTGLLAAIVPAITASRESVLASLTGRRGVRRSNRMLPALGLIALVLGAMIALYGSAVSSQFAIVAGGSAIAELGVVALTPALVGLFGRSGRWLPLAPRLALRVAVRNRGRTAPAVAAVLAAVAGTVTVSTYAASSDAGDRAAYQPRLPYGVVSVSVSDDGGRDVPTVRTAIQQVFPIAVRADVDRLVVGNPSCLPYTGDGSGCGTFEVVVPKAQRCPLSEAGPDQAFSVAERRALMKDWRCDDMDHYSSGVDGVKVADAKLLKVLNIHDSGAVKALAAGQVVSFDKQNLSGTDRIDIRRITDSAKADAAQAKGEEPPGPITSFPVYQVPGTPRTYGISMIVPTAAARSAGFLTVPSGGYFSTTKLPSDTQRQKLDSALGRTGSQIDLYVERGYTSKTSIALLALSMLAGLVTIGAAGIATGLAQADAEADLKTLAAIGAPSRVRRILSGFQCGVIAAMGVLLGAVAGLLPAVGLRLTERREDLATYRQKLDMAMGSVSPPNDPVVIPWATLAVLLIAVPLGAALLAALVTRSQKALGRRAVT